MSSFYLSIITPEKNFYSGEIEYLSVDTPDGKVGFLRGAMPRISVLSAGHIIIKTSVIESDIICGDGLICVEDNEVTILTEKCSFADGAVYVGDDSAVDAESKNSSGVIDKAKARIASSLKKMRDKTIEE